MDSDKMLPANDSKTIEPLITIQASYECHSLSVFLLTMCHPFMAYYNDKMHANVPCHKAQVVFN